jgi:KaiC/GvpD/RAD55 family RecA-like ATPase
MSETYDVSDLLPGSVLEELPAGTNVAIIGPTMSGKRGLALQLLATGYETSGGILCITTDSAESICDELERNVGTLDRDRVGIIDTSGSDGQALLDAMTETVSSPSDLTGISIGAAKLTQRFENRGIADIRYGLISVSTLLQYMNSKTVFKFLHVYTKRISSTGALGIYTLNTDSHDSHVVNTMIGLFDGVIEIRESDAGEFECRVRGFGGKPTPWKSFAAQ